MLCRAISVLAAAVSKSWPVILARNGVEIAWLFLTCLDRGPVERFTLMASSDRLCFKAFISSLCFVITKERVLPAWDFAQKFDDWPEKFMVLKSGSGKGFFVLGRAVFHDLLKDSAEV